MQPDASQNPNISRVPRSRQQAQASYDRLSRWYDALAGSERRFTETGLDMLAAQPGESVLEIGYGTGHALIRLARAVGATGRVIGIDLSRGMCAVAQQRIQRAGLSSCIELATGDACRLPLAAGSLDGIFMSFTLELFDTPDIPLVLDECRRVLIPGGRICIVSLAAAQPASFAVRCYEWLHARFPAAIDCRPIMLRQALEAAQFHSMACRGARMWGLPVEVCLAAKNVVA